MIRMDDNDDDDSIHDHLSFDDDVVMAVVLNYRTFIGVIYIEKLLYISTSWLYRWSELFRSVYWSF